MYLDYKLLASFRRVLESLSPLAATDDNPPRAFPPKRSGSVDLTEKWGTCCEAVISWTGARGTLGSFLLEIESLRAVCDTVLTHIDLKGDNIIFARNGLVKISLQPCGHEDAVESSWREGKLEFEVMSQINHANPSIPRASSFTYAETARIVV